MKDGRWHGGNPRQVWARVRVFRNEVRRPAFRGVVHRYDPAAGTWAEQVCPHGHTKRSSARECARLAAGRLNRGQG